MLVIVAQSQPIARAGAGNELMQGSASDIALHTPLQRGLIANNALGLPVTTAGFLKPAGWCDQPVDPAGGTRC